MFYSSPSWVIANSRKFCVSDYYLNTRWRSDEHLTWGEMPHRMAIINCVRNWNKWTRWTTGGRCFSEHIGPRLHCYTWSVSHEQGYFRDQQLLQTHSNAVQEVMALMWLLSFPGNGSVYESSVIGHTHTFRKYFECSSCMVTEELFCFSWRLLGWRRSQQP